MHRRIKIKIKLSFIGIPLDLVVLVVVEIISGAFDGSVLQGVTSSPAAVMQQVPYDTQNKETTAAISAATLTVASVPAVAVLEHATLPGVLPLPLLVEPELTKPAAPLGV